MYVILSFPNCDPFNFLNPVRFIAVQLKLLSKRKTSLKTQPNFFSKEKILSFIIFLNRSKLYILSSAASFKGTLTVCNKS